MDLSDKGESPPRNSPAVQPEARLFQMGLKLPDPPQAVATYRSIVRSGTALYVAGQGPMVAGKPTITGKVGKSVTVDQAYEAARLSCLNALAILRKELGTLSRIKQVVRATVYVASAADFTQQPKVANGATDLLRELFGEAGLPARAAVGVNVLPLDIPVEFEIQVEVE